MSPAERGASQSRTLLRDRYRGWVRHHRLSAADSLYRVLERPVASVLTWLVIGIALALPVGLQVGLDNVSRLGEGWDTGSRISLFLEQAVTEEQGEGLAERLRARGDISAAQFLSREAALAEFAEQSGLAELLVSLDDNPLPHLVIVTPDAALGGEVVASLQPEFAALEEVAEAVLDMEWLARLTRLMELGSRFVLLAGALLVLGVVLILGNTIRLAIESRREEIVIVKLVGGSNPFVRRPFLYTGLWYGVGGGLAAALLVAAALWFLGEPASQLAALYGSGFTLQGPGIMGSLNLILLGGLLGLAGAWLAVSRHLAEIEPR